MYDAVILGLGNILYADEGFGVRVAERLYTEHAFPESVALVDAGTLGNALLGFVEETSCLLLIDAADFGLKPGTLFMRSGEEIPRWLSSTKASLHQNSFAEILALAELRDKLPKDIRLIGFQPVDLTFGKSLSPQGRHCLDEASQLALRHLHYWKIDPTPQLSDETFQDPSISFINF